MLNTIEYQLVGNGSLARRVAAASLTKFGARNAESQQQWLSKNKSADASGIVIRDSAKVVDAVSIYFDSQPLVADNKVQSVLSKALSVWDPGHWIPYGDVIAGLTGATRGLAALASNSQDRITINIHQARAIGQLVPKAFLPSLSSQMIGTLNSPWLGIMATKDSAIYCHLMVAKHAHIFLSAFYLLLPKHRRSALVRESADDPSRSLGLKERQMVRYSLQHLLQLRNNQWWHAGALELGIILEPIVSSKQWLQRVRLEFATNPIALDWGPIASIRQGTWNWQTSHQKRRPLEGLRILDISQVVAGPLCGMLLSTLGADVTHIQLPERLLQQYHKILAPIFQRNKNRLTLDFTHEGQRQAIEEFLIAFNPHLVVHNLRPKAKANLLDSSPLGCLWSRTHFIGIQAFPDGQLAGFEQSIQAATGLMIDRGGRPRLLPLAIHDIICGAQAALAAVASLWSVSPVEATTCLSQAHALLHWAKQQKDPTCPAGKSIWNYCENGFFPADNNDKI